MFMYFIAIFNIMLGYHHCRPRDRPAPPGCDIRARLAARHPLITTEPEILEHSPIIFVAGMPRSGSMWTYNVCRRLISAAGKRPWPEEVPQDESPAIRHALAHPPAPDQVYCIKTHFEIPVGRPHMRIVCNYRDVRDAMISYMRFMKCPFEKGLAVARGCMKITDHYLAHPHPDVLPVRYDDILATPQQTIGALAGFLALVVPEAAIAGIAQALSRESVQHRLEELEALRQQQDGDEQATAGSTTVRNMDGSMRAYDARTGFQSNHVSSSRDGEWRQRLSAGQQAELMDATAAWLARYGFRP
jgi:hypothetical protein